MADEKKKKKHALQEAFEDIERAPSHAHHEANAPEEKDEEREEEQDEKQEEE